MVSLLILNGLDPNPAEKFTRKDCAKLNKQEPQIKMLTKVEKKYKKEGKKQIFLNIKVLK